MTPSPSSANTLAGSTGRTWSGLAGARRGEPTANGRAFVLLHGLTFDRRMWDPVLAALPSGHPVLTLDLPGHGASPALPSHRLELVVEAIHAAVLEAELEAPIMVGHSLAAGLAGIYAVTHPTSAIVNVDSPVWLEPMARSIQSLGPRLRNGGFADVWPLFTASMHRELLPQDAQALLQAGDDVSAGLVLSYWADLLDRSVEDLMSSLEAQLAHARAAQLPYVGVHGKPIEGAERAWLEQRLPHAEHVVWPVGHHFPHIAHPERFAALLTGLAAALPPVID
jgi:pimeloyl-ACP methyl ester carboxylesterase